MPTTDVCEVVVIVGSESSEVAISFVVGCIVFLFGGRGCIVGIIVRPLT